jgi:hypothetical protein
MADILIRGMEMPKENDTPILAWIYSDWNVVFFQNPTKFSHGETTGTSYGKKAKAIQLPAGHGRLVDADALMKKGIELDWSVQKWVQEVDILIAPTIVPAEGGTDDEHV